MPIIRQHHSSCEPVKTHSEDELITEQFHAPHLEIKNMVKNGSMHFTDAKPMYGDFTDLPTLESIQVNRLRIVQVHNNLHPKVRKHFPTADSFIQFINNDPTEEQLIEVGLKQREVPLIEPPPVETPVKPETPAE